MKTVRIDFSDPFDLAQAYIDCLRNLGLLHSGPPALALWSEVNLECLLPEGAVLNIPARAVQMFPGPVYGLQLVVTPATQRLLARAREAAEVLQSRMLGSGGSEQARKGGPAVLGEETTEDTVREIHETTSELTPTEQVLNAAYERFRRWINQETQTRGSELLKAQDLDRLGEHVRPDLSLNLSADATRAHRAAILLALPEKQQKGMAASCGPMEREIFLEQGDPSLQLWILKNPDLTESEAVEISRRPDLTSEALRLLLATSKWFMKPRVARNLLLSPSIPRHLIPRLLTVLPSSALRQLIRRAGTPADVRQSAFGVLRERTD